MSKKYKQYLWNNDSLPRRTLYRYRSNTRFGLNEVHEENLNIQSRSEEPEINETISSESSTLSDNLDINDEISSEDSFSMKDDLEDIIKNGNKPLYDSACVTSLEAFVSILAYSIKFNLSKTCVDGLLKLMKALLPPSNLPDSKFLFYKGTSSIGNACEIHLYCPHCDSYICKLCSENKNSECQTCSQSFNSDDSIKNGHFFLYMPLAYQLQLKFENEDLLYNINNYKSKFSNPDTHRDILDGCLYRSTDGLLNSENVSIQFNVDGIPIYRKSRYDIWPIQVKINELEPLERKRNIMVCGLWFGRKKPNMNEYLVPFVDELNKLQKEGLKWMEKGNGEKILRRTKVFTLVCTSDAPARCALQNFKQFNGQFGCGFCEEEGERIMKGKGFCRVYPFNGNLAQRRTFVDCVESAEKAISTGSAVKGVKGASVLMNLYPTFNMIDGFIPDYMHCVLLGVTRQLVCLFIESSGHVYSSTAKDIRMLDTRIRDLKLPHEASRKLRTTKDVSFWKASEWQIFLLSSPVLLKNILNHLVYKHWLHFVHGVTLLLGSNISADEIEKASDCLKRFVLDVKNIYGIEEQSYNIHLLLHLSDTVKAWGPLWANSCFSFEDNIGHLKDLHHGTKCVPLQIATAYASKSLLDILMSKQEIKNQQIITFVNAMQAKQLVTKQAININGCMLFGKPTYQNLLRTQEKAFKKLLGDQITSSNVQFYKRMCYSGHIYSCKDYCSKFIHADYVVALSNKNCVEIHHIVVLNDEVYFLGEYIPVTKFLMCYPHVGPLCSSIFSLSNASAQCKSKTIAFRPVDVVKKYATLSLTEKDVTYFIPINIGEY